MTPSFSSAKLRALIPMINESIQSLSTVLKNQTLVNDGVVDVLHYYCLFSMDIILACAFGTKVDVLNNQKSPIAQQGLGFLGRDIPWETMTVIAFPTLATKFLGLNAIPREAGAFFANLTANVVARRQEDPSLQRPDFIQFLMAAKNEDGSPLMVKEISDNGIAFFVAGFDTTAHTLTYTTYELAMNPDKQSKLHQEVDQFFRRDPVVSVLIVFLLFSCDNNQPIPPYP